MRFFRRNTYNDVIFLEPVVRAGEKLPKGKMRMLYCDSAGKVYASLINTEVYKLAVDSADRVARDNKDYATIGLEISPGNYLPLVIEIGDKEVWALENVLEHARRSGAVPDILKKHLSDIIGRGTDRQKSIELKRQREYDAVNAEEDAQIFLNLPYYAERDIEFFTPIYKQSLAFPLMVLKIKEVGGRNNRDSRRLLVLDNDGDMAIIKVPVKMMLDAQIRLEEWASRSDTPAFILVDRDRQGFAIGFLVVNHTQKKAIDSMAKHFEKTGLQEQPISDHARRALARAREAASLFSFEE